MTCRCGLSPRINPSVLPRVGGGSGNDSTSGALACVIVRPRCSRNSFSCVCASFYASLVAETPPVCFESELGGRTERGGEIHPWAGRLNAPFRLSTSDRGEVTHFQVHETEKKKVSREAAQAGRETGITHT